MRFPTISTIVALLALAHALAADPLERASFNSAGGLTSLISNGRELPIEGYLEVAYPGGVSRSLQPHDQSTPVEREGIELAWAATVTFPNNHPYRMEGAWKEDGPGIRFDGTVIAGGSQPVNQWMKAATMQTEAVAYVLNLPHETFAGWHLSLADAPLPSVLGKGPLVFSGKAQAFTLKDPSGAWTLKAQWEKERDLTVKQVWSRERRAYQLRILLSEGPRKWDDRTPFAITFSLAGEGRAAPVSVTRAPAAEGYPFDGFGGNFCFNTATPAIEFLIDRLPLAWARIELKAGAWISERGNPGPLLKRDFELMKRMEKAGIPWALSIWRLPEVFYADANRVPPGTFGRRIAEEKWPEFLEVITSFIQYSKDKYGAEPDFFSFNEPDLGVDIGFTGETHRDAIKRIGRHFLAHGIATKQLLGDTANPRDTHLYTLPAAQDPEAMQHVGAISFHSWFAASPAQYRAWADVARWIDRPLIVGEAGLDPGAYRNRSFDSYSYGLREMAHLLEILRDTQARSLLYWQYTEDYGLVRVGEDDSITPTGRFRLMEQLIARTPLKATAKPLASDQGDVLAMAFEKDGRRVIHLLNRGLARDCTLGGLVSGPAALHVTDEKESRNSTLTLNAGQTLELPARSLVTLVIDGAP